MISEEEKRKLISGQAIVISNSSFSISVEWLDINNILSIDRYSKANILKVIIYDFESKINQFIFIDLIDKKILFDYLFDIEFWITLSIPIKTSIANYLNWLLSEQGKEYCLDMENKLNIYS